MSVEEIREGLERHQIGIYLAAIVLGALLAFGMGDTTWLESLINPALGVMLFVTFLQVPLSRLRQSLTNVRFMAALLVTNFVAVPVLVFGLSLFFPKEPLIQVAILFVLLCPCIDYVVTFSQVGKADSSLLLASTPVLLVAQMALLPIYLMLMLGDSATGLVQPGPFVHAFVVLILIPLLLSALGQFCESRSSFAQRAVNLAGALPVPATALVLFVVIAAVTPQLSEALPAAERALPIYVAFAVVAPLLGMLVGRVSRLRSQEIRALSFSAGTRNSLVVLPLALAIPGAVPIIPAVIVTQTLVELTSSIIYMRVIPKIGSAQ
ncbi:arsenic resistance protein [Stenotrophomonas maltophilia]|nr:arsenic resistance protein [Stenotrophomonas maltophilia]